MHSDASSADVPDRPLTVTSARLLERARQGDSSAFDTLLGRYLPRLRRWTHGRLPRWSRTIADTTDLVQDVMLRTIRRLDVFEPRGPQALGAYLYEAVRNRIRDEHRTVARRGIAVVLSDRHVDSAPSPFDETLTHEMEARYREALDRLCARDRDLLVAHLELDYTHEQLGCMIGRSRNAARMALHRAIGRLAREMRGR
jgi:RNA polymerase sigma-70 factor (ECF subfamily)